MMGPQIHGLTGFGWTEVVEIEANVETGEFYSNFLVHDSIEADAQINTTGRSAEPVCWMQRGYASGYVSALLGRPVIFEEVECRAMGHTACRLIGKTIESWQREKAEPPYFRPSPFVNRFSGEPQLPTRGKPSGREGLESEVVGISAGFGSAMDLLDKAAPTDVTVLFLGETGVGKEVFARSLHRLGPRAEGPFIAVNCAALPEQLLEAELFGVVKGAYTGASQSRPGRFERASGGTLFLDEIGTLNLAAQAKLLRALQERVIERVGDTQSRRVNVRVMAATNVDLRAAVRDGEFREDLYFRLTTFPVRIPPLRERRDDIPLLVEHFMRRYAKRHGSRVTGFTERAVEAMLRYDFPGNIRELENMIERGILLAAQREAVDLGDLFFEDQPPPTTGYAVGAGGRLSDRTPQPAEVPPTVVQDLVASGTTLEVVENQLIDAAVQAAGGNLSEAARRLGLSRRQLSYRLDKRAGATDQHSSDR